MGRKSKVQNEERVLFGAIMSYVHAGGTEKNRKRLKKLQSYLKDMGFDIDLKSLALEVSYARAKMGHKKALDRTEAELFTPEGKPRRYRYASAFCPNCGMFKNYEKECPYCTYHEMTL